MQEFDTRSSIHYANSLSSMPPEYLSESRLWFPRLAEYLVADLASRVKQRRALVDHYGTQRWLTGNSSASIDDIGAVRLGRYSAMIERLPISIVTSFSDLTFADNKYSQATAQVQAAAKIFDGVDTLADTVGCLVRSIHLLRAPRDHDVSHSSPELPFSIFVSVPEPTERHANLRVAESIVHESMHLQLSLLGAVEPLLGMSESSGYSPWKRELRPVEGLLHGIYVFAVIHQVLGILTETQPFSQAYCIKRRDEIQTEVSILPEQANGLSAAGNILWQKSRRSVLAG
jgi:HEXXH motif-containing protein